MGYSDSDWAGDRSPRKSQRSGDVEVDGCPLTSFSRRRSCVATSSGMAEHCAMCSTAEELLHLRSILEHLGFSVNTTDFCDSVDARGSEQRAGLGKVRTLAVETLWLQEVLRERDYRSSRFLQRQTRLTWERKFYLWPDWTRCEQRVVLGYLVEG